MRKVCVAGIGQTKISEHWDKSLKELAGDAVFSAMQDAGMRSFDALYVGNMMASVSNKQHQLGTLVADWVGARGKEALRFESACSSGSAAFRSALMAIASGEVDSAVVVGVEKMTDSPNSEITAALATAADADWESIHGISFVGLNALIMQRYLHEYGWKREDFAGFSINAHKNAVNNRSARLRFEISEKQFADAAVICDPITLLDASPVGDGAAAAILIPFEHSSHFPSNKVVVVAGSGAASDNMAIHSRKDPLWLSAAERSAKAAYSQAGITPRDIDFFEYHDAFTIMAALSLEASGFADRGKAPALAADGSISLNGSIPVATMGGLKARGHPVGGTGMCQIIETVQQIRGEGGKNQVANAKIGMAQNIGGSGSHIITHIFTNA